MIANPDDIIEIMDVCVLDSGQRGLRSAFPVLSYNNVIYELVLSRKLKDLYIKNPQNKLLLIALHLVLNEY